MSDIEAAGFGVEKTGERLGDQLLGDGGDTPTISGEHVYDQTLTAYNLQIDSIHTYYAGATPVLVHNACVSDADGLAHAADRHLPGGSLVTRDSSLFDPGTNLADLADSTYGRIGRYNSETGNVEYVINAERVVGTSSGISTTIFTVIRDALTGDVESRFPGLP